CMLMILSPSGTWLRFLTLSNCASGFRARIDPRIRHPRISGGRARCSIPSPRLEPPIASWVLSLSTATLEPVIG
ncbi:hypothetical protein A2U01_0057082, partial [Trifolium medium]|nr:hypothetical protein [Trifolium medium]